MATKSGQQRAKVGRHSSAHITLQQRWERLHESDREPWPDAPLIGRFAKRHRAFATWVEDFGGPAALASAVQVAWEQFHAGKFQAAIEAGARLGALGATVANKAAAVHSLYSKRGGPDQLELLDAAIARGETAVAALPDYANAHYTLALALGRYSQGISILKALAAGIASRVRMHLERTLALEPLHAEAHVAFGLYHAEIINKLGAIAASLTYAASSTEALNHFERAAKLAPDSPIVHMEYANGLLLLDSSRHRERARDLYAQAAACVPADEMERLDAARAKRGLA